MQYSIRTFESEIEVIQRVLVKLSFYHQPSPRASPLRHSMQFIGEIYLECILPVLFSVHINSLLDYGRRFLLYVQGVETE